MTNIIRLAPEGASYKAEYDWKTYRFLLSNGNCIDVEAVTDDSWLRDEILKIANKVDKLTEKSKLAVTICGVALIEATTTTRRPTKLASKRAAKKD